MTNSLAYYNAELITAVKSLNSTNKFIPITRLKVTKSDKQSSLLQCRINYDCEKF